MNVIKQRKDQNDDLKSKYDKKERFPWLRLKIPFCHKATTGGRVKSGKAINAVAFSRRKVKETFVKETLEKETFVKEALVKETFEKETL